MATGLYLSLTTSDFSASAGLSRCKLHTASKRRSISFSFQRPGLLCLPSQPLLCFQSDVFSLLSIFPGLQFLVCKAVRISSKSHPPTSPPAHCQLGGSGPGVQPPFPQTCSPLPSLSSVPHCQQTLLCQRSPVTFYQPMW